MKLYFSVSIGPCQSASQLEPCDAGIPRQYLGCMTVWLISPICPDQNRLCGPCTAAVAVYFCFHQSLHRGINLSTFVPGYLQILSVSFPR